MQTLLKRKLLVGTVVVAAAAFAGGAYAATQNSTNPRQEFLGDVAKRLNVTPQKLTTALARFTSHLDEIINHAGPRFGEGMRGHFAPGGPARPGWRYHGMFGGGAVPASPPGAPAVYAVPAGPLS